MKKGNKYEIEPVYQVGFFFESQVATLTGIDIEEVKPYTKGIRKWKGRTFIELFNILGFNCNHRFVKFDSMTKYPCLMRTVENSQKTYWYGFAYYDNYVYIHGEGKIPIKMTLYDFSQAYPMLKITSMLQVWI